MEIFDRRRRKKNEPSPDHGIVVFVPRFLYFIVLLMSKIFFHSLTTRSNHAKVIDYLALSPLLPSISTLYLPLLREIFKADDLAESEFNSALALLAEEGMNATTTTMTRGNRRRSSRLNSNRYVRRFEWDHNHGEDRGEMEVIVRDDGAFSL